MNQRSLGLRGIGLACLAMGSFLAATIAPARGVTVSLPTLNAFLGEGLSVPLAVDSIAAGQYFSLEARVRWDPGVVQFVNPWVDFSGGVASTWTWAMNRDTAGEVFVAAYGTSPLSAAGNLFRLHWQAVGSSGESTSLDIVEFHFNELTPPTLVHGSVTIRFPSTVNVSLEHRTGVALGSDLCVALTTAASPESVYSFQTTISWDQTMLDLVSPFFDRSGSLTAGNAWTVKLDTSASGRVGIAAWSTSPLAGAGNLGCLRFHMRGRESSWSVLRFEDFRFNEGFPAAHTIHGRVDAVAGKGCIIVDIPDTLLVSWGRPIAVPVSIDPTTPTTEADSIFSFQSMITWDPDLLELRGGAAPAVLNLAGPAGSWGSSGIEPSPSTPGRLRIVGFGTTPMIGSGTVFSINLKAREMSGISSAPFDYTFRFNEGTPCTVGSDGQITVPVTQKSWGAIKAAYRK